MGYAKHQRSNITDSATSVSMLTGTQRNVDRLTHSGVEAQVQAAENRLSKLKIRVDPAVKALRDDTQTHCEAVEKLRRNVVARSGALRQDAEALDLTLREELSSWAKERDVTFEKCQTEIGSRLDKMRSEVLDARDQKFNTASALRRVEAAFAELPDYLRKERDERVLMFKRLEEQVKERKSRIVAKLVGLEEARLEMERQFAEMVTELDRKVSELVDRNCRQRRQAESELIGKLEAAWRVPELSSSRVSANGGNGTPFSAPPASPSVESTTRGRARTSKPQTSAPPGRHPLLSDSIGLRLAPRLPDLPVRGLFDMRSESRCTRRDDERYSDAHVRGGGSSQSRFRSNPGSTGRIFRGGSFADDFGLSFRSNGQSKAVFHSAPLRQSIEKLNLEDSQVSMQTSSDVQAVLADMRMDRTPVAVMNAQFGSGLALSFFPPAETPFDDPAKCFKSMEGSED